MTKKTKKSHYYLHIRLICHIFVSVKRYKDMTTGNFIQAVNEIRTNGGNRQTMYVRETWKDREMTIFTYCDGSVEVFESTRPFMTFGSEIEAIAVINKMQEDYDKAIVESNARYRNQKSNIKIESYSIEDWYSRSPRGTYFGD